MFSEPSKKTAGLHHAKTRIVNARKPHVLLTSIENKKQTETNPLTGGKRKMQVCLFNAIQVTYSSDFKEGPKYTYVHVRFFWRRSEMTTAKLLYIICPMMASLMTMDVPMKA